MTPQTTSTKRISVALTHAQHTAPFVLTVPDGLDSHGHPGVAVLLFTAELRALRDEIDACIHDNAAEIAREEAPPCNE